MELAILTGDTSRQYIHLNASRYISLKISAQHYFHFWSTQNLFKFYRFILSVTSPNLSRRPNKWPIIKLQHGLQFPTDFSISWVLCNVIKLQLWYLRLYHILPRTNDEQSIYLYIIAITGCCRDYFQNQMTRPSMHCNDHGGDSASTHRLRRKYKWTLPISFIAGKGPAAKWIK